MNDHTDPRAAAARRIVTLHRTMNEQTHAGWDVREADVDKYVALLHDNDFYTVDDARAFLRAAKEVVA